MPPDMPPQPPAMYREADGNIVMSSQNMVARFFHKNGATPLQIYQPGAPPLLHEWAGSGSSAAWRDGQDPTQATPNGPMGNPIHIQSDVSTAFNNYWGRETIVDFARKVYEVKLFCPDFFASFDPHDDAIPPAPGFNQAGWYTRYNPGRFTWLGSASVPIVFSGEVGNTDGWLFVADELNEASPWAQKLREYRQGRFALKANLSLYNSGRGAFAGFIFRATIPPTATTKHEAYNAPGIRLFFNKSGAIEATRVLPGGHRETFWRGQLDKRDTLSLLGPAGISVEIRTHNNLPGVFWLIVNKKQIAVVTDEYLLSGPHLGFYANSVGGYVTFQERAPYDVGVELTARWEASADWLVSDYTVALAPGVREPRKFDRVNLPGMFLNLTTFSAGNRTAALVFDNAFMPVANGSHLMRDVLGAWVGNSNGSLGLLAIPEIVEINGQPAPGFHIHMDRQTAISNEFVMMLDAMQEGSITEVNSVRIRTRWATKIN